MLMESNMFIISGKRGDSKIHHHRLLDVGSKQNSTSHHLCIRTNHQTSQKRSISTLDDYSCHRQIGRYPDESYDYQLISLLIHSTRDMYFITRDEVTHDRRHPSCLCLT